MMFGDHWMFGGFMWLFWIAVLIGLFFLIRWFVQQSNSADQKRGDSAMDILKKRYAKGEIDKDEYEQKKKDINI